MKVLFLGDIVGRAARESIATRLPELREKLDIDFTIINAENAAGGFGVTPAICQALFAAGADVLTTGNHAFDQNGSLALFAAEPRLLRPANYPPSVAGEGGGLFEDRKGRKLYVANLMGRVFMPPLDDPFAEAERIMSANPMPEKANAVIIDFHAEASSEKMAMGHFCDGRASLVVGTHSHVPSADLQILPGGTAYQTDAGMCGDYNSVIGMEKERPLAKFITGLPSGRYQPASGPPTLCGVCLEIDPKTGKTLAAAPLRDGGVLAPAWPDI